MRFLVVGHQGYIGSGLFEALSRKHTVIGWGRKENLFKLTRRHLSQKKIQVLINCAVVTDRETQIFDPKSPSARVNVGGAKHLARTLPGSSVMWVQISTKDVFGNVHDRSTVRATALGYRPRFFVDEHWPFAPETIYAKTKLMAEQIAESYPLSNIVRLSTCYGDYDHPKGSWMVKMVESAMAGRPITVTHDGRQFRDPLHVDDLARLIELLARKKIHGEAINAGGGVKNLISINEYLKRAAPGARVLKKPGDDFGFAFDIQKAKRLVGWQPRVWVRKRIPVLVENIRDAINQ